MLLLGIFCLRGYDKGEEAWNAGRLLACPPFLGTFAVVRVRDR